MLFHHFRKCIVWTTCCLRTETRRWPPTGTPFRDGQISGWGTQTLLDISTNELLYILSQPKIYLQVPEVTEEHCQHQCWQHASDLLPSFLLPVFLFLQLTIFLHVTVAAVQTASVSGRLSGQQQAGCSLLLMVLAYVPTSIDTYKLICIRTN